MANDSPAVILYDGLGNPVGVVLEGVVYKLQAQVTGAAPAGSVVAGNPVLIAGSDGTNVRTLKTLADGTLAVDAEVTVGDITANNSSVSPVGAAPPIDATFIAGSDGTNLRGLRTASDGTLRIDPIGTTTQPISAVALPLPTGAATEVTLATLLTSSTFTSRINTLGQKAMTASTPVVLASDQSAIPVTDNGGSITIDAVSLPLPTGAATETTLATRLSETTFTNRINTLGQKTMNNSTPVVLASDQSALAITASSLPLPTGAATETTLATRLADSTFTARINTLGQKTMANSTPVVLASDQNALSVTGTITANVGTTNGLALDATLTGGTAKAIVRGGAKGTTTAADVTSVSIDTNTQALHVQLAGQGTPSSPIRIDPTGTTTQPISALALPLPTGAATETTLSTRLADSTFTSRINTLGQKTMANSTPVVISSDQSALTITGTVTSNIGTTNGLALDATLTGGTAKAIVRGGAKGSTAAADVTSASVDADTQALHVAITGSPTVSVSGTVTVAQGTAANLNATIVGAGSAGTPSGGVVSIQGVSGGQAIPISAASLPLPSGAATESTLATRLADATFTSRINTLGQKTMANSTPVVIASNQTPISVSVIDGGGTVQKSAYDIQDNVIYIGTAAQGTATSAADWLIKRITLVGGEPTFTEWSSTSAIWDDRATETYS